MIRRTLAVATILAPGSVVAAAVYWLFLNTPESNVMMLAASLLLVLTLVAAVAVTVNASVLRARGVPRRTSVAAGSRGTGWFLIAAVPLLIGWWLIGRGDDWILRHQGEINAWFIARFGWADIGRLLQLELWVSRWLRWGCCQRSPFRCSRRFSPASSPAAAGFRRAWHWRTLLAATAVFLLLFALPWQLRRWRRQLPPTWIEPAVTALRLGVVFLLGLIGAAVMIVASAGSAPAGQSIPLERESHE